MTFRKHMKKIATAAITILYIHSILITTAIAAETLNNSNPRAFIEPSVTAPSAVLMDADNGVIIFSKEMNESYYPASITKIMTALLTLEYAQGNYDEKITFSNYSVFSLPYDSSNIAMDEGETLTIKDALHGLMLSSANEVANALAEHIAGDVNTFAVMMTNKAKELGAFNSSFVNPHGLHDPKHYTTAHDMALIMKEALKYDYFKQIISTIRYDIPPTEKLGKVRELLNTNRLIRQGEFFYENAVGGKTGFTDEAQHTLVTYGNKDGINLISVVMHDEKSAAYTDSIAMFNYGFELYRDVIIFDKNSFNEEIPVTQIVNSEVTELGSVKLSADKSITMFLPSVVNSTTITKDIKIPKNITPPVKEGDVMGKIIFKYGDIILGETSLTALNSIEPVKPSKTNAKAPVSEPKNLETEYSIKDNIALLGKIIAIAIVCIFTLIMIASFALKLDNKRKITKKKQYSYKDVNMVSRRNYGYK